MSIYSHDDGNIIDNDDCPWGEPLDLDPNEVWDIDAMITSMCSSDGQSDGLINRRSVVRSHPHRPQNPAMTALPDTKCSAARVKNEKLL